MFNESKTTQAAARLVKKSGGKMNYMLLVKMLYMADRRSLLESGLPITYDRFYTMKNGPILSVTLELISKPQNFSGRHPWLDTFVTENYEVKMLADFDQGELSEFEEEILDKTFERFEHFLHERVFAFPDWMHANLPEVKTIECGRIPLEFREILEAENRSPEEIETILSGIESVDLIDTLTK
jgi:hypothetical protein